MADAYPLQWPASWPRSKSPRRSRFKITAGRARDNLIAELQRMGAKQIVISTNVELRNDGLPYSNRRPPADAGVAVYFMHKGKQQCIPCDRWDDVGDNMHAIRLTVQALRGIDRWGSGSMVDAAFSGFKALPAATVTSSPWYFILGVPENASPELIRDAYRDLSLRHHPDRGGSVERMTEINTAYADAKLIKGIS